MLPTDNKSTTSSLTPKKGRPTPLNIKLINQHKVIPPIQPRRPGKNINLQQYSYTPFFIDARYKHHQKLEKLWPELKVNEEDEKTYTNAPTAANTYHEDYLREAPPKTPCMHCINKCLIA